MYQRGIFRGNGRNTGTFLYRGKGWNSNQLNCLIRIFLPVPQNSNYSRKFSNGVAHFPTTHNKHIIILTGTVLRWHVQLVSLRRIRNRILPIVHLLLSDIRCRRRRQEWLYSGRKNTCSIFSAHRSHPST